MNRKLLMLDVLLAAAVVYAGFQLRNQWLAAKAREAATLRRRENAPPPPHYTPLPVAPAVLASGYNDIAQKMLFDRSRNPTVVVEVPPAPPPKPVPPLPVFHGVMNIDGVSAIMSATANAAQEEVRPGGMIGPFKLVDVTTSEIVLEWDGKVMHKTVEELSEHNAPPGQAGPAPQGRTAQPVQAAAAPAPAKAEIGPGQVTSFGTRTCNANDSYPNGAVVDGYRKVISSTPFGPQCRWEPVGR